MAVAVVVAVEWLLSGGQVAVEWRWQWRWWLSGGGGRVMVAVEW